MYRYEIEPMFDSQKSFYRKAYVVADGNTKTLYSYDTAVIEYDCITNTFRRLWHGWSVTTGRHIKEFCKQVSGDWKYNYNKAWLNTL